MTLSQFDVLKNALAGEKRWSGNKSSNRMRRKFLDAGCGAGNILLFAKSVGLARYYHGLEYFDDTYKKARDFLGLDSKKPVPDVKIFQQDILTFKNYGDYDIIYFYCPFSYGRLEVKFEELVEDQMKLGAVLIANLKRGSAIYKDERFERLADKLVSDTSFSGIPSKKENIFIKISDAPRKKSQFDEKRSWLHDIAVEGAINKKYGE
jgi:SAM-dependent methyltransferase